MDDEHDRKEAQIVDTEPLVHVGNFPYKITRSGRHNELSRLSLPSASYSFSSRRRLMLFSANTAPSSFFCTRITLPFGPWPMVQITSKSESRNLESFSMLAGFAAPPPLMSCSVRAVQSLSVMSLALATSLPVLLPLVLLTGVLTGVRSARPEKLLPGSDRSEKAEKESGDVRPSEWAGAMRGGVPASIQRSGDGLQHAASHDTVCSS